MKKHFTCDSVIDIIELRKSIVSQIDNSVTKIKSMMLNQSPIDVMRKIKFQKLINDTIFDEQLNFIEYINQTFTYLVCLYAGEKILHDFPNTKITINFGTQSGYDIASTDGLVVCECFAATTVKSNDKLKKDILRLHNNQLAKCKMVVFYSENIQNESSYIESLQVQYGDVKLYALSFEQLLDYSKESI